MYFIANKFNTTVNGIKEANNLVTNNLSIGQQLIIPAKQMVETTNLYTVKQGDSLYSIANKYNTTVDELKTLNNLTTNNLSIGQQLKLPIIVEEEITPIIENTYTVKQGDSLYSIANKYSTTVDEIKTLNNLTTNNLSIGQVLILPVEQLETNYELYTVKSGDSLYNIAKRYNITVDELKTINNITNNLLSIGQQLKIPLNNSLEQVTYTVKQGDSLYSIASKYNTTVNEIKTINNLTNNLLNIGQKLIIP